ncbi:MAG: amino acid racemase [Gordonia sp. (in: high G+C Gram-positive bacteria)]|uniref:aspartate/glutamate racemase family protein n=1 Tax=Gordonia sp. (in: high G+C Gram-positive bacteria) TaxID=84139 RepID=UPI0039E4309E
MKKLGLIGGTGPESTVFYYKAVIDGVQRVAGPHTLPELTIESLSVFRVLDHCSRRDFDGLAAYLSDAITRLAGAGADVASLTALTPHIVFDRLRDASPIPLVSAVEATSDAIVNSGATRLALLGTEYTMTEDFFTGPLRAAGLDVVVPDAHDVTWIQDKIATELEYGVVRDDTRDGFVAIIERLRGEGAQQVILGCTELPLILDDDVSPLPCLDPVPIHARALVAAITD